MTPRPTAGSCCSSAPRPSGSTPPRNRTCACGPVPRWVRGGRGSAPCPGAGSGAGAGGAELRLGLGLLQGAARGPLFINICSWKRVPAPQTPTDPTPVSAGPLEEVSGEAGMSERAAARFSSCAPALRGNLTRILAVTEAAAALL